MQTHEPTPGAEVTLPIVGMTCASCVNRVERFLKAADGVAEAQVNLATESATIRYLPDQTGVAELAAAITASGYEVPAAALALAGREPDADVDAARAALSEELATGRARASRAMLRGGIIATAFGFIAMFLMLQDWLFVSMDQINQWLILPATLVQFYVGWPFHSRALRALRHGSLTMETLVSLGTTTAWGWSVVLTIFHSELMQIGVPAHATWDAAALIIGFVSLGRWMESRAREATNGAVRALLNLRPSIVEIVPHPDATRTERVELARVIAGDLILVRPGDRIPVDGIIVRGGASLDESAMSGESIPVLRDTGARILAGTLLLDAPIVMRAVSVGSSTALARIVAAVERAQGSKPAIARLADRISAIFVPTILLIALATFAAWYLFGAEPRLVRAVASAIAVLVVACPCAMGLATPTAVIAGIGRGSERGILVRDAAVLETAGKLKAVIWDKTGTLTLGRPAIVALRPLTTGPLAGDSDALLIAAAAAEAGSEHPLGRAIVAAATAAAAEWPAATARRTLVGGGVVATIDGASIAVGSRAHLLALSVRAELLAPLDRWADEEAAAGHTVVYVALNAQPIGLIALADEVRPEAAATVRALADRGIASWIISGDRAETVAAIAARIGIPPEHARGGVLPREKGDAVEEISRLVGGPVAMVGDGINDAPALAAASVGIAMGGGAEIAVEAASATLASSDLHGVVQLIDLARATTRIIKQNLTWAFGYNIILVPLAAGALLPTFGIGLDPALAAAAMGLSSVTVVLNSLRLRRLPLERSHMRNDER